MGVHNLWSVLAPAGQTVPLTRLAGRTLAVDLSGWICQAVKAKALAQKVHKPHLRNLFFRVSTLYRLGASLVFVVDGEATRLKWVTLDRREGRGEGEGRSNGRRGLLQCYVTECCNLLDCLGVPYIQSQGEAEALCSVLNSTGLADGVLTNDSDAFLYGATTVYRDLNTSERPPKVECYTMKDIHEKLGLTRSDLIALALLLGCDYCPHGVVGVGKETALQFLRASKSHSRSSDVLDQFRDWRNGHTSEGDIEGKIELNVFRKSMKSPHFPQEEVIREFLCPPNLPSSEDRARLLSWKQPRLKSTEVFCRHHLHWRPEYVAEKMAALLSQWAIREAIRGGAASLVSPSRVLKRCRLNGESCYHVHWRFTSPTAPQQTIDGFVTVERQEEMQVAFSDVCEIFKETESAELQAMAHLKQEAKALAKKHRQEQRALEKEQGQRCRTRKSAKTSPSAVLPGIFQEMVIISPPPPIQDLLVAPPTLPPSSSSSSSSSSPLGDTPTHGGATTDLKCADFADDDDDDDDVSSDCEGESPIPSLSERLARRRRRRKKKMKTDSSHSYQDDRGTEKLAQTSLLSMSRIVRSTTTTSKPTTNADKNGSSKGGERKEQVRHNLFTPPPPPLCYYVTNEKSSSTEPEVGEKRERVIHNLFAPPSPPGPRKTNSCSTLSQSPGKLELSDKMGSSQCVILTDSPSDKEGDRPLRERIQFSVISKCATSGCHGSGAQAQGTACDPIVL